MINNFEKFLESFKTHKRTFKSIEDAYIDFEEQIANCYDEFKNHKEISKFFRSYSDVVRISSLQDSDPKQSFEIVNDFMTKSGWDLESVKKLVDSHPSIFRYMLRDLNYCAAIDVYLYQVTSGKFPLQGFDWDFDVKELDVNEWTIRYSYGWHKSKYGILCIEQNLGSITAFLSKVKESLPAFILEYMESNRVFSISNKFTTKTGGWSNKTYLSFFQLDEDDKSSYWIFLQELYDYLEPGLNVDSYQEFQEWMEVTIKQLNVRIASMGGDMRVYF